MSARQVLERLANELPTIAIGAMAVARVLGIDTDAEQVDYLVESAQSVIGLAVWFLVRRKVDGPVTVARELRRDRHDGSGTR